MTQAEIPAQASALQVAVQLAAETVAQATARLRGTQLDQDSPRQAARQLAELVDVLQQAARRLAQLEAEQLELAAQQDQPPAADR